MSNPRQKNVVDTIINRSVKENKSVTITKYKPRLDHESQLRVDAQKEHRKEEEALLLNRLDRNSNNK